MSELTEFILARLVDDERDARDYGDDDSPGTWRRWGEDVCAALRAVVELHETYNEPAMGADGSLIDWFYCATCDPEGSDDGPCRTLRAIAGIWATHPDYRPEEWA